MQIILKEQNVKEAITDYLNKKFGIFPKNIIDTIILHRQASKTENIGSITINIKDDHGT